MAKKIAPQALAVGDKVKVTISQQIAGRKHTYTLDSIFKVVGIDGAVFKIKHPVTGVVSAIGRDKLALA